MILVAGVVAAAAAWTFAEETIRLTVLPDAFRVEGTYTLHCTPGAPDLPLLYPFPEDASLGVPEPELVAFLQSDGSFQRIDVHVSADGWRWIVPGGDAAERTFRVIYRQAASGRRATYVLRSTQQWTVPLERAVLEVVVPAGLEVSVTPALEPVAGADPAGGPRTYRSAFRNWMPEGDLVVAWDPGTG